VKKKALELEGRRLRDEQQERQRQHEARVKAEKIRKIKEDQERIREAQGGTLRPKKEKIAAEKENKYEYKTSFKPSKEEDDEHTARLQRIASATKVRQETPAEIKKRQEEERKKREDERKQKEAEELRKKQEKIEEIKRQYNSQMESVKSTEPLKVETVTPLKAHNISSFMPTTPAPKPGDVKQPPKPLPSPKPLNVATGFKAEDEDEMAKREEARLLRAFALKKR